DSPLRPLRLTRRWRMLCAARRVSSRSKSTVFYSSFVSFVGTPRRRTLTWFFPLGLLLACVVCFRPVGLGKRPLRLAYVAVWTTLLGRNSTPIGEPSNTGRCPCSALADRKGLGLKERLEVL